MRKSSSTAKVKMAAVITAVVVLAALAVFSGAAFAQEVTQGTLQVMDKSGQVSSQCPLKHTDVKADISGFISRVKVVQEFQNPFKETIEAVYVFPLPQNAAVDSMTMKIGNRVIKGVIKKKEEARKIYEDARRQGKTAALLDQERPNIFTQSVANITPGATVKVEISYVKTLTYTDGMYEFVFPMVVGPRYMPGAPTGKSGTGWSPDTSAVPDASKISPPVAPKGTRAGHDISLSVNINAGVPIKKVRSVLHKINLDFQSGSTRAKAAIKDQDNIPNKDFILQYETGGAAIEDAILTHGRQGTGFFTMILQPPKKPTVSQVTPKEMFFVIDSSGSQMGWPIEKAKETMKYCIENMNPGDTFQVLSFDNNITPCFDKPKPNTRETREQAQQWLATRMGGGGTEMMKAIDYSLGAPPDPQRLRIVMFMTDGYVGNDMQILATIKEKLGSSRLFPFGCGNSVNRYLLEGMAKMGKGEVEWVTLNRHGDEVAETFQDKIGNPLLLDISVDWGNAPVKEIYPKSLPDLFSGKPVIIKGRYTSPYQGTIILKGKSANKPFARKITVNFPKDNPANDVLGVLWARTKVEELMNNDLKGIQSGQPNKEIKEAITRLGLEFRLMTQFTSFVAVEEKVVNKGGKMQTIAVPVEMPDGVSHEGVFGEDKKDRGSGYNAPAGPMKMKAAGNARTSAKSEMAADAMSAPKEASKPSVSAPVSQTFATNSVSAPPPSTRSPFSGSLPSAIVNTPAKIQGGKTVARSKRQAYAVDEEMEYDGQPARSPESKLDASLKGLAARVKSQGRDGDLKTAGFQVRKGRVELIVTVSHVSDKVLAKLRNMGFTVSASSKARNVIRGTLPVSALDNLAKAQFVRKIEPNPSSALIIRKSAQSSVNPPGRLQAKNPTDRNGFDSLIRDMALVFYRP